MPVGVFVRSVVSPAVYIGDRPAGILAAVWLGSLLACISRRSMCRPGVHVHSCAYVSYWLISVIPFVAALLYYSMSPVAKSSLITVVAFTSLLPLLFDVLWVLLLNRHMPDDRVFGAVAISILTIVVSVVLVDAVAKKLLDRTSGSSIAVRNSEDRRYWYYSGDAGDGAYGMYSAPPKTGINPNYILVLGDSMPAARREKNFVAVAESLIKEQLAATNISLLNAGMAGFSLEQIELFYKGNLLSLRPRPRVVVLAFYLDDINRELRYRKGPHLYSPIWPEWMQDIYYRCLACRAGLNLAGFSHLDFQYYRTRTYREALPSALETLGSITALARHNGAVPLIINVPMMVWKSPIAATADYHAIWFNNTIERWAAANDVPYVDAVSGFLHVQPGRFVISSSDHHFNDAGHEVIGQILARALVPILRAGE